jgi:imidazolonepropionase-like amidohydrolase
MSKSFLKCAAVLIGLSLPLLGCRKQLPQRVTAVPIAGKLRFDDVTIVDTQTGELKPGMSIVTDAGRIVAIAPTESMIAETFVPTIDATGKFAVPGYNNMHVHVLDQENSSALLALMLIQGVTGFRQMSGSPELLEQRRKGTLPIGKDAPALLAMPGSILTPFNAGSVSSANTLIDEEKREGADFIKVGLVSPEVFFAAIAQAKRVGLPALGHLQEGVDAGQASQAGFRTIEHLGPGDSIWIACSTDQARLQADAAAHPAMKALPFRIPSFVERLVMGHVRKILVNPAAFEKPEDAARLQKALNTYDEEKCRTLAARFVENDTWHVPTLVRLRTQELIDSPEYQTDPALRTMKPDAVKEWREVTDKFDNLPPSMRATFHEAYPRQLALTKLLDRAGVPMMAGTDDGGRVPGQSLHQEFDELSKAGLSPLKILQMTTLKPAQFLGRTATMGTIDVGKNADMVLLDGDPIKSVQNLHRIHGVVRAGFYYSDTDLNALETRIEAGQGELH